MSGQKKYPDFVIVVNDREYLADDPYHERTDPVNIDHVPFVLAIIKQNRKKPPLHIRNATSCVYCDCQLDETNRTKDHFIPRSRGGKGGDNSVAACSICNTIKGDQIFVSIEAAREFIQPVKADFMEKRRLRESRKRVAENGIIS